MSRSENPILLKELFTGVHLVAIIEAKNNGTIKFSDGQNKSFEKIYDFQSSEFLKLCYSASTIKDACIFDNDPNSIYSAIGKRLWICIKEVWTITNDAEIVDFELFDTLLYNEGPSVPPKVKGNPADNKGIASGDFFESHIKTTFEENKNSIISDDDFELAPIKKELPAEKKKIIAEAKEMIKNVQSSSSAAFTVDVAEEDDSM